MPIVKLAQQIKNMEAGQVLKLVADDPGSKEDVPAWCRRTGNELMGTEEESNLFIFHIKKS
jgi:tRNA 2-thiouridine synthesizing protein A